MTSLTSAAGARQTFGLAHAEELRAGFTPRQVAKSEQAPQSNLTPSGLLIEHFNLDSLHARRFFLSNSLSTKVYQTMGVAWIGFSPFGTSDHLRDLFLPRLSETLMPRPPNKTRELRTALAVALGLAIASFGAAVVAAGYITK
jgi:hypothetical protein